MKILILFIFQIISGFIIFSKKLIPDTEPLDENLRVSVIIPARNEESNLPHLLGTLASQTCRPYEIIVVDDFSEDKTYETACKYGASVIRNSSLPGGWTGKTSAVWNGFLHSSGDILVFLDADVRLAPRALELLLKARKKAMGVISVVPYHYTERFYERLALISNILGVFAFMSPFEEKSPVKGLYGSCIVCTRSDYERVNGHNSISSELLDDLTLGRKFLGAGIPIKNFIGNDLVSFRMYPQGIISELQGFGKGAVLSTSALQPMTLFLTAIWLIGILITGLVTPVLLITHSQLLIPFLTGYILYTIQIFYFKRYVGRFGIIMPLTHFLSSLFFILIMLYSTYQVVFLGHVKWKGRNINVRRRRKV